MLVSIPLEVSRPEVLEETASGACQWQRWRGGQASLLVERQHHVGTKTEGISFGVSRRKMGEEVSAARYPPAA
jgi:hypothetical protein